MSPWWAAAESPGRGANCFPLACLNKALRVCRSLRCAPLLNHKKNRNLLGNNEKHSTLRFSPRIAKRRAVRGRRRHAEAAVADMRRRRRRRSGGEEEEVDEARVGGKLGVPLSEFVAVLCSYNAARARRVSSRRRASWSATRSGSRIPSRSVNHLHAQTPTHNQINDAQRARDHACGRSCVPANPNTRQPPNVHIQQKPHRRHERQRATICSHKRH